MDPKEKDIEENEVALTSRKDNVWAFIGPPTWCKMGLMREVCKGPIL